MQRSAALDAVLAAVAKTGLSAHPFDGKEVSDLVFIVAIARDVNPVALQAEVEAWADYLDAKVAEVVGRSAFAKWAGR